MIYAMDKNKESGLSIIELMVALLLSSLLILGVTQIYIDNKRSYLFQQGQVDNSDAARFSAIFLENELNKAGFRRRPDIDIEEVFKADSSNGLQSGSVAAAITNGITYRYQASHPGLNSCDGAAIASIPSEPYVGISAPIKISKIQFADGALKCDGEIILEDVADFKLLYAVGARSDGGRVIKRYTSSPQATEEIRGIKYDILLASPSSNLTDIADNIVYSNWRKTHYDEDNATPPDRKIYQVASNTIIFRNITP